MAWDFEPVAGPFEFTEGPVWDGEGVLFTDITTSRILRYVPATGECDVYATDTGGSNGLKMAPDGTLYACEMVGRRLTRYDPDGERSTVVEEYEGGRLNSPNDLAIDGDGRVWFTDPHYGEDWEAGDKRVGLDHRSIYRVDPDDPGSIERVTYDTTNPNGMLLSPDDDRLYVAQSEYGEGNPRELRAYPVEDDGTVGEYEVLHNFYPHRGIDGMCLDEDGNIVATAGWPEGGPGPMVYVFTPAGRVLETHPAPQPKPTNCAFGDDDLQTLYLTGSDGYLYRARTDRRGHLGAPSGGA